MQQIAFCRQCSAPRRLGNSSCPYCGVLFEDVLPNTVSETKTALSQTAPAMLDPLSSFVFSGMAPASTSDERLIGVVPYVSRHKGFLGLDDDYGNLVVSSQQLVFAVATESLAESMEREIMVLSQVHAKDWRRLFSEWDWRTASWRRYLTQPIERTLAESKLNSAVRLEQIKAAKFMLDEDIKDPWLDDLEILTDVGKVHFSLGSGDGHIAIQLLRLVLGGRVDTRNVSM